MDLESRMATFRLQAGQRLLYCADIWCGDPAWALLRRAGGLGLDPNEPGGSENCRSVSVLRCSAEGLASALADP